MNFRQVFPTVYVHAVCISYFLFILYYIKNVKFLNIIALVMSES